MKQLIKKHRSKLSFGIIGLFNTGLDFALLLGLTLYVGLPKELANIISTFITFLISFALNRRFTFPKTSGNVWRQLVLFTIVTLFGLWVLQGIIIMFGTPPLIALGLSPAIALIVSKLAATAVSLVWNYVLYSRIVFRHTPER